MPIPTSALCFTFYFFSLFFNVKKHNFEPNVSVSHFDFKFSNVLDNVGWVRIQHRNLACGCFVYGTSLDSFPKWKGEWFYLYMDGDGWGNYFRSNFSLAEDWAMRSFKLGVDEDASIHLLVEDDLHYCTLLISKTSFEKHGLSDLSPESIHLSSLTTL